MSDAMAHWRLRRDHAWTPPRVSAYLDGELTPRSRTRIEHHLGECAECRRVLDGMRRMLRVLHELAPAGSELRATEIARAVGLRLHEAR
jgi:predicted anti-sigma-YlaC factor YlaD